MKILKRYLKKPRKTWHEKRDPQIVADIRTKISNVIYDYDLDKNKYGILQSLYRKLETLFHILAEGDNMMKPSPNIKHHLFVK